MAKVITVINQKGGVAKTTTTATIGAGLRLKGFKVLFIDLDAQGNLSYSMGAASGVNAFNLLNGEALAVDAIQQTLQGDLIASSDLLSGTRLDCKYGVNTLKAALEPIQGAYDYILIDTPPALGILTINALTACNVAIIPALTDIYSLQAIGKLYRTIETVKKNSNPDLNILGILLIRYKARTILSQRLSQLLEVTANRFNTKIFNTKIRTCISLPECQTQKKSIFDYAPRSNAAEDYKKLVNEILRGF